MGLIKRNDWADRAIQVAAFLNGLAVLFVLSIYAYGGLFSRHQSDDYCQSATLLSSQNLLDATIKAYNTWLGRYSILSFVQLTEWGGTWGARLMTGVTLLLWMVILMWLVSEIEKAVQIKLNPAVKFWVVGLIIFLSLYQAPALYQILYWRSGLPYTLPLVFFIGIAAFVLWYARSAYQMSRTIWAGVLCVGLVFYAGGFGETTAALQVGAFLVAILTVWLTKFGHQRKDVLILLITSLMVALTSILLIAFSPGTGVRLNVITTRFPIYNPFELSRDVVVYTFQFLWDAFKVAPLPNLISIVAPLSIMYFQLSGNQENLPKISSSRIRLTLLLLPVFMFIVIGCSFAPSAFVRTFPVARARFAAHFVLTFALALEGGILGMLLSTLRISIKAEILKGIIIVFLGMLIFYPLRASTKVYASLSENRTFAAAWDVRDAYIRRSVSDGVKDLTVVQLDSIGGVGEYKGNPNFWINTCAAQFYGLNTLIAP